MSKKFDSFQISIRTEQAMKQISPVEHKSSKEFSRYNRYNMLVVNMPQINIWQSEFNIIKILSYSYSKLNSFDEIQFAINVFEVIAADFYFCIEFFMTSEKKVF